jgi:2-polyprenyl-3-methyl-5-hydroxy-6-metoxy-1,4-benzoquinol methylase
MSYDERYFAARGPGEVQRATMRAQELERVRRYTGREGGVVVDVGCGLGELLDLLPADRWRKDGLEASESAVRTPKQRDLLRDSQGRRVVSSGT